MVLLSPRVFLAATVALLLALPAVAASAQDADSVAANAQSLYIIVSNVDDAVANGDWDTARTQWAGFDDLWDQVEDGFRAASRDDYRAVESHQTNIRGLLRADSPDADQLQAELASEEDLLVKFGATN
jgi:hypothetical protein